MTWQYVLTMPEHGNVGVGPTDDLRAVEQDQKAWLDETGKVGTIMRRRVGDWEDMPAPDQPDVEPTQRVCGQAAVLASHGGGTDYSAPCLKVTNAKGRHKGPHRDHLGREWQESVR